MNRKFSNILFFTVAACFLLFSCAPKRKVVSAPVIEPPKIQVPKIEDAGALVPFTRELFFKLKESGLDIKKLKFYVDKSIALNRTTANDNFEINEQTGSLVLKKGVTDNVIKITPQVAGMVESIEADGVRLNFGRPNSSIKFINNAASPKFFVFSGDKVDKATGNVEVNYNNGTYKATNEGGGNANDIKLMIKQLDIETGLNKPVIEPGAGKYLGY